MVVFDMDDWQVDHDCREKLEELKKINPAFKVTLFAVPGKTTLEMLEWAKKDWVELGVHGWMHESNYECMDWTDEFCRWVLDTCRHHRFAPVFKAPGWQINENCYHVCLLYKFIVADQPYNVERRPDELKVYEVGDDSLHTHTWDCGCGNGIYEDWENIVEKVKSETEFKFITELF